MVSVVEILRIEGRAEGALLLIQQQLDEGQLTREQAVRLIRSLAMKGHLDGKAAQKAIEALG